MLIPTNSTTAKPKHREKSLASKSTAMGSCGPGPPGRKQPLLHINISVSSAALESRAAEQMALTGAKKV